MRRIATLRSPMVSRNQLSHLEQKATTRKTSTKSTAIAMTQLISTHVACCPSIAIMPSINVDSKNGNTVWMRRSFLHSSILKPPRQFQRWTFARWSPMRKQSATVVRFNPVVLVKFFSETTVNGIVHTTPICNDCKDTRQRRYPRHKSLPSVKLPII